ncbi:MAG: protein adenylyltransferase SelO family protein, partial [Bacteriovoracia bacterium]
MFQHSFADQLNEKAYTLTPPTPVRAPKLLAWSNDVAAELEMVPTDDVIRTLAGNQLLPGMKPIATRYGGHQFGHWAGQLGDGRAILLGEKNGLEIQLKGAGVTPYSRRGDGRAVLRSSVREYLCSEAMHFLGIPTTRALSLVGTGEEVLRDMFYDGNSAMEPGAIVTRVAPSFIRFGHFQIHTAHNEIDELKKLIDYTLSFYPGHTLESFFQELCERTAKLMVEWMRVGFVHGVMNTDNMSILGLTIDYGPYGWLDIYDPNWTPNTTDNQHRRYRFSQQPGIALWNLNRLAEALSPVSTDLT